MHFLNSLDKRRHLSIFAMRHFHCHIVEVYSNYLNKFIPWPALIIQIRQKKCLKSYNENIFSIDACKSFFDWLHSIFSLAPSGRFFQLLHVRGEMCIRHDKSGQYCRRDITTPNKKRGRKGVRAGRPMRCLQHVIFLPGRMSLTR